MKEKHVSVRSFLYLGYGDLSPVICVRQSVAVHLRGSRGCEEQLSAFTGAEKCTPSKVQQYHAALQHSKLYWRDLCLLIHLAPAPTHPNAYARPP